ncbi:hypothetical protein JKP88DRAFT_248059 [Tribonema minus]|uniref:Uncharacterized protein n=1 Tax=Tribonema minus TaxID=303371 RepID=A0A835YXG9_9STRA|nr:hypothetical protein JKP88DRAFT_248059 [Tribonema minus]
MTSSKTSTNSQSKGPGSLADAGIYSNFKDNLQQLLEETLSTKAYQLEAKEKELEERERVVNEALVITSSLDARVTIELSNASFETTRGVLLQHGKHSLFSALLAEHDTGEHVKLFFPRDGTIFELVYECLVYGKLAEVQPKMMTSEGKSNDHAPKCLKLTGATVHGAGNPFEWTSVTAPGHPDYFSFDGTSSININHDGAFLVILRMNCTVSSYAAAVSIRNDGTDVATCHTYPTNQMSSIVVTDVLEVKKNTELDGALAVGSYQTSHFKISGDSQFSVAYLGAL